MNIRVIDAARNVACDGVVDRVDMGVGTAGELQFWSGVRPATVTGSPAGVKLAAIVLGVPAFGNAGAVTPGRASALGTPRTAVVTASGTIGWVRVVDKAGGPLWDEDDVGVVGDHAVLLGTLNVMVGDTLTVNAYNFDVG